MAIDSVLPTEGDAHFQSPFQAVPGPGRGAIWVRIHGAVASRRLIVARLLVALACLVGLTESVRCESVAKAVPSINRDSSQSGKATVKGLHSRKAERRNAKKKMKRTGDSVKRQSKPPVVNRKAGGSRQIASIRRQDVAPESAAKAAGGATAQSCEQQLRAAMQPIKLIRLAEECESLMPEGAAVEEVRRIASGARSAMEGQRLAGMSAELFEDPVGDDEVRGFVARAVRGDMDAAYAVAQAYKSGRSGVEQNFRRMEQWLVFSAELGHGRASWELAEHYNSAGLVSDAARFERKAIDLGYRPPIRLPSRGY